MSCPDAGMSQHRRNTKSLLHLFCTPVSTSISALAKMRNADGDSVEFYVTLTVRLQLHCLACTAEVVPMLGQKGKTEVLSPGANVLLSEPLAIWLFLMWHGLCLYAA